MPTDKTYTYLRHYKTSEFNTPTPEAFQEEYYTELGGEFARVLVGFVQAGESHFRLDVRLANVFAFGGIETLLTIHKMDE